ncbi:YrzI family small protein [Evansella sp. AB-P1]|nr:YrzI family small protein [Evansella sp. AB-P1]MDG5786830.1 YrzI family small protein [Evansella sp. AB-P1]
MIFNLFFITITISKREFTNKDMQREQQRQYSRVERAKMQSKQAQYTRLM